jgi:hypothetical protein
VCRNASSTALDPNAALQLPLALRLPFIRNLPLIRDLPPRLVGFGIQPEHVKPSLRNPVPLVQAIQA